MEARDKIELTPEQKGMLASLSQETGKPVTALIQEALDALQSQRHSKSDAGISRINGDRDASIEAEERRALKRLEAQGILYVNDGGKPQGVRGVTVRGVPMSATVLDARR
jgi:hypothetical protein